MPEDNELRDRVLSAYKEFNRRISELEQKVTDYDSMIENLYSAISKLSKRIEKLEKEIAEVEQKVKDYDSIKTIREVLREFFERKSYYDLAQKLEGEKDPKLHPDFPYRESDYSAFLEVLNEDSKGEKTKPDRGVVAGSSVTNRTVAQTGDELCNTPHLETMKPEMIFTTDEDASTSTFKTFIEQTAEPIAGSARQTDYINEKGIFLSDYYYPCNIINCPIKEASLSYQGNYYCLKHFVEMVQDDRCEKEDLEWLINDILDWRKAVKREPLMDKFGRLYEIRKKYLEEDDL